MPESYNSTAIDLSRLPAPVVIEQVGFEVIFAGLVASMQELLPSFDAAVESEPVVKLLQLVAYREMVLRQQFNDRARSVMVAYATGANLENLAALMGVSRLIVTPANPVTGAAAVMESDEDLRSRTVLAPEAFTTAGAELAYVFHARSADANVLDASAISPAPGQVLVTVLSRLGNGQASPAMMALVTARLTDPAIRPLADNLTTQSATIVNFAVAADLYLFTGPDTGVVIAAAQARLDAYLDNARKLGRDITRSAIIAALHAEGVQRVVLTSPVADLIIAPTQAGHCTATNLDFGGNAY